MLLDRTGLNLDSTRIATHPRVLSGVVFLAAATFAVCGFATADGRLRALFHVCSGLLAAVLFVTDLGIWIRLLLGLGVAHLTVASLGTWRGVRREHRGAVFDATCGLGIAFILALVLGAAALAAGTWTSFADALAIALPLRPIASVLRDSLIVLTMLLALDGVRPRAKRLRLLWIGLAVVALFLAGARLAWLASMASLPMEVSWSEAPALVNALKLDAHMVLYGPPAKLDSYTYSPLLNLLHHALLTPLGAEVSLYAHRTLIVAEQLVACALLVWALGPAVARAGWSKTWMVASLVTVTFASMLAAAIHPDHLVLVAFATAVALLVGEARLPRAVWWTALVLVAPFAAAAKLTGVGVGVGLAVVFALERRWGALAVAVASLGLAAMTVPFFNATLGAYSFYAIDVQRAHPIEWAKLATLASTAHVQITIGVAVLLAWARWLEPVPGLKVGDSDSVRVGLLTAVCAVASLPAWLKYAGRDNNLALLAVGATCAGLLGIAAHVSRGGATIHPALGPAAALLGLTILAPPISPFLGPARAAACSDAATIERAVREDDQAGRHTLAMPSVARWIAAGHRDVPPDRIQSAIELFYAEAPAADLLFSHIEDGRYDSVVVMGEYLQRGSTPVGRFDGRLRAAIESRYTLAEPRDLVSSEGYRGALVFRRSH